MEKQLTVNGEPIGELDVVEIAKDYLQEGLKESEVIRKFLAAGFQEDRISIIMRAALAKLHSEESRRFYDSLRPLIR
ncbi:MAG: hypothetical protein Q8O83_05035 [bacterium]|nr:hypothetical protein [bacterium]